MVYRLKFISPSAISSYWIRWFLGKRSFLFSRCSLFISDGLHLMAFKFFFSIVLFILNSWNLLLSQQTSAASLIFISIPVFGRLCFFALVFFVSSVCAHRWLTEHNRKSCGKAKRCWMKWHERCVLTMQTKAIDGCKVNQMWINGSDVDFCHACEAVSVCVHCIEVQLKFVACSCVN